MLKDMYAVAQELGERKMTRMGLVAARSSTHRALELALAGLSSALVELAAEQRSVFAALGSSLDEWVRALPCICPSLAAILCNTVASLSTPVTLPHPVLRQVTNYAGDLPSDEDSQDGFDDAKEAVDDSSSGDEAHDEAPSSSSVALLVVDGARTRTYFGEDKYEGGTEVGGATPARETLDAEEAGKAFLRTILSLSNADAGLHLLRQAFAQRMAMREDGLLPARAAMAQQAFEHDALLLLLRDDFKLAPELAAVVRAEVMRKPAHCLHFYDHVCISWPSLCCPLLQSVPVAYLLPTHTLLTLSAICNQVMGRLESTAFETVSDFSISAGSCRIALPGLQETDKGTDKEDGRRPRLSNASSTADTASAAAYVGSRRFLSEIGYVCLFQSDTFVTHLLAATAQSDLPPQSHRSSALAFHAARNSWWWPDDKQANDVSGSPGAAQRTGPLSRRWKTARIVALTTKHSAASAASFASSAPDSQQPSTEDTSLCDLAGSSSQGDLPRQLLEPTHSSASLLSARKSRGMLSPTSSFKSVTDTDQVVPHGSMASRSSWRRSYGQAPAAPAPIYTTAPRELIDAAKVSFASHCLNACCWLGLTLQSVLTHCMRPLPACPVPAPCQPPFSLRAL
jgi:hypothetical protein